MPPYRPPAARAAGPRAGVRGRRLSLSARRRGPPGGRGAACVALGFNRIKIKIGGADLDADRRRIETVLARLPTDAGLAVDAMNAYGPGSAQAAARALSGYGLWWFEDICDPLDFETLADVAASYPSPIAAGEALFSPQEARLLARHGGLRPDRDVLVFDPAHCHGLTAYVRIVEEFWRAAGPRGRSGRMAGTCSACMWRRDWAGRRRAESVRLPALLRHGRRRTHRGWHGRPAAGAGYRLRGARRRRGAAAPRVSTCAWGRERVAYAGTGRFCSRHRSLSACRARAGAGPGWSTG